MIKSATNLILILFLLANISAQCNDGQIDINSASKEKLMDITQIGNSTADKIITYRQNNLFNSVDELTNISGIKEAKLEKIKSQGLACVSSEQTEETENETEAENQTVQQQVQGNNSEMLETNSNEAENPKKPVTAEIIKLNPEKTKDIKTNSHILAPENIAIYGLVAFCILLAFLFAMKKIKKQKTEFGE